jgi:integrase
MRGSNRIKKKQYGVRIGGKLERKSFASAAAARAWQDNLRKQYEREVAGLVKAFEARSIEDVASRFLERRQHMKTYRHDLYRLRTYVLPYFHLREFHRISRDEWENLLGEGRSKRPGLLVTKHKLSNRTSNLVRGLVSTMYEFARVYLQCSESNPIRDIKPLPEPKKSTQVIRPHDMSAYVQAMREHKNYPEQAYIFAMLSLNSGQRLGQIQGLLWEDCDFDSGLIFWIYKWDYQKKAFVEGSKKGDGEHHSTGMNDTLRAALLEWRNKTPFNKGSDFVLAKSDGFPLTAKMLFDCNKRGLEKAGLPHQKIHALRHSYATAYVEQGGSIYDLQEILNHSSITVTERYRQLNRHRQQKTASVLQVGVGNAAALTENDNADFRAG